MEAPIQALDNIGIAYKHAFSSEVPRKGKIGCHRNTARKNWTLLFGEEFPVPAKPDAAEVPTAVHGGSESKEVRAWEMDGQIWVPLASKRNQQLAEPMEYSESSRSPAKEVESHPTVQTPGPDDRPNFGTKETVSGIDLASSHPFIGDMGESRAESHFTQQPNTCAG